MNLPDVIAAAAPLRERLAGHYRSVDDDGNVGLCAQLAQKWAALLSKDDPGLLARRLALEGHDEKAFAFLGRVALKEGAPQPPWAEIFRQALAEAVEMAPDDWDQPVGSKVEAWDGFHQPFLRVGRRMFVQCIGETVLSESAMAEFERALRARLFFAARASLELDFSVAQAVVPGSGGAAPSRADFCRRCYQSDGFFSSYPALARLLSIIVEYWVETIVELADRLTRDEAEIRHTFFPNMGEAPLRIAAVSAALSDPHRRGRGVVILTFSHGGKLVYKPRSLGLEAAYFDFVAWLNALPDSTSTCAMRTVRCLDRGDYGWMEWVSREDCAIEADVALYFERAGAMLALLYALAGSDMHYENIVAHGDQPVPVDLEVLMVPSRVIADETNAGEAAMRASLTLLHSVRSVGLLPEWLPVRKGQIYNSGGLGSVADEGDSAEAEPKPNFPRHEGRSISSHLYRPQIIDGFEKMYEFLRRHRDAILAPGGPLTRFKGLPVRMVNRATNLYGRILAKAVSPGALASGTAHSFEFDILMKNALVVEERWQQGALDATIDEIIALERGDIPFFQGRVDDRDLTLAETGGVSKDFFGRTGYDTAQDRFRVLSAEDLAVQLGLIRLSFDLIGDTRMTAASEEPTPPTIFRAPSIEDEIVSLAREICSSSIRAGDSVTWIAPQIIAGSNSFQLRAISDSLYDGTFGVLPFLLAAARNYGEKESGRVALAIVESFRKNFAKLMHRNILRQSPIGLSGLGGSIYSLLLAATSTGNTDIVELAADVAALIDDSIIGKDRTLDIIGGVAGAIPPLLHLHAMTGDARWLELAAACGDRLLATREVTPTGQRSWKVLGCFLSGYSHGAAGIAASLLRLHAATGDVRFQEAADEAVAYENTLFVAEESNWQDIRFGRPGFMNAWCHGAPGIALGRIMSGNGSVALDHDIASALKTTTGKEPSFIDQACCGNAGRADVLALAARHLGQPDFLSAAHDLMSRTVAVAKERGGYVCYGSLPRTVRGPGYFQGLSGIGYTLARIEDPTLPSILAMEL